MQPIMPTLSCPFGSTSLPTRRHCARSLTALPLLASAAVALLPALTAVAAPLVPGDVVVYTINGSATLSSTATPVQLQEYNPTLSALVQTIPLATTGTNSLTASGTAASDGGLNLSADGSFLSFTGYNVAAGTTGVTNTFQRIFAVVDPLGSVNYSAEYNATGANVRTVVSAGAGSGYYVVTSSGLGYTPTLTGTVSAITGAISFRGMVIAGGNLYGSVSSGSANGGVNQVGTGLPTGPAITTQLPGFTNTTASQNQLRLLDLDGNGSVETLYLALGQTGGGIQRYNLVGGVWTLAYTLNTTATVGFYGVTARVSLTDPSRIELFATTQPGATNTGGNQLLEFFDSSVAGNTTNLGLAPTVLATAGANQMFRGVDFAPTATIPEPSTWAMIGGGLLTLLGLQQRKRRARRGPSI